MPVGINQPSNQIKLTNVSLVRMKKGKQTSFNDIHAA
jgi:ribosome maturation protein SDO1